MNPCTWRGFPGGTVVKNLPVSGRGTRDVGSIFELGRSSRGGNVNPLQYSYLEFHGQRSLTDYRPWGHKESDTTEWMSIHTHCSKKFKTYFYLLSQNTVMRIASPCNIFLYFMKLLHHVSLILPLVLFWNALLPSRTSVILLDNMYAF